MHAHDPIPPGSEALKQLYYDFIETSQDLIWQCDATGRYTFLNPAWEKVLGYTVAEMIGRHVSDFQPPEAAERDKREFARLLAGGMVHDYETVCLAKHGHPVYLSVTAKFIRDGKGTIRGICGTARDISERKQAETALLQSEKLSMNIFDKSPALMAISRLADQAILQANNTFLDTLGFSLDEVIGKTALELGALGDPNEKAKLLNAFVKQGYYKDFEMSLVKKDGTRIIVLASAERIFIGDCECILTSAIDITSRKEAEKQREALLSALRESEERLRMMSDNLPNGAVYQIDSGVDGKERRFTHLSAGMGKLHELPTHEVFNNAEIIYKQILPEDLPLLAEREAAAIATMTPFSSEARVRLPSGALRWRLYTSAPRRLPNNHILWDGIELDITERKQLEETLQRTQRLESLGILAGGIAHDFNNLLGGIFGCIDLSLEDVSDPKAHHMLSTALNTLDRARNLTHQLLTFSKGGAPIKRIGQLSAFIKETVLFALSGSRISSSFRIAEALWPCNFDKNQIGQVIDNIVINAQQAMPDGGTIHVAADNVRLIPLQHPLLAPGPYVKMSIRDSGIGMPHEILSKIFDPFYTTKSKGHGLGLATCYSIITRHEGCIEVESEPGKGSTFHVYLPASPEAAPSETVFQKRRLQGAGTILVMDDEEVIRATIAAMLTSLGYTVANATNGDEALAVLGKTAPSDKSIVAAILDLTIPGGRGGREIVGEIRRTWPQLPLFVASGYANDPILADPPRYGFTASIGKPFVKSELGSLLQKHLHDAAASTNHKKP